MKKFYTALFALIISTWTPTAYAQQDVIESVLTPSNASTQEAESSQLSDTEAASVVNAESGEDSGDYVLQTRMTVAAEQSARWSEFQFYGSVFAGIVLILTLIANAYAAFVASKAADAAVKSVQLANRGYVGVSHFKFNRGTRDNTVIKGISIDTILENSGNAPVIVKKTIISTCVIEDGDIRPIDWSDKGNAPKWNVYMGAKVEVTLDPLKLDLESLKGIYNNNLRFLYMFKIDYQDLFSDAFYHTNSCFEIKIYKDPEALLEDREMSLSQFIIMEARGEFGSAT